MSTRLLIIVALVAAGFGVGAAQDKPASKRPAPAATERAKPEQKKPEQKAEPAKPEPTIEERVTPGDPEAQYQLGERYRTSDYPTAVMWYVRAADQGHQGAIARVIELTKRYQPAAPAEPVAPPAGEREPSVPVPSRSSRENTALAVSVLALAVSVAAIVFSWTRTRKALRDAGLL